MRRNTWIVTGDPGVGKSTLVAKVVHAVKSEGYTVGGIVTRDVRRGGERIGFEIFDLASQKTGVLASSDLKTGPRMGRYRVNLNDLAKIAGDALTSALSSDDLIVCDELGPMELLSPEFRRAASLIIESERPLLCSMHKRLRDPLLDRLRDAAGTALFEVTVQNRDELTNEISAKVLSGLREELGNSSSGS